jgi:hypothetical protein
VGNSLLFANASSKPSTFWADNITSSVKVVALDHVRENRIGAFRLLRSDLRRSMGKTPATGLMPAPKELALGEARLLSWPRSTATQEAGLLSGAIGRISSLQFRPAPHLNLSAGQFGNGRQGRHSYWRVVVTSGPVRVAMPRRGDESLPDRPIAGTMPGRRIVRK